MSLYRAFVKTVSTFFFVGYLPLIPGTFGSLAGLVVYYAVRNNPGLFMGVITGALFLGWWAADEMEKLLKKKDAGCIVIDEVCGILISLLFIPYSPKFVFLAFFLFRVLDTLKPYPAGPSQKLKGGIGVMIDDVIAGIYTNIILQLLWRLVSLRTS